jgi:hypothetical protein
VKKQLWRITFDNYIKKYLKSQGQWLTPVILAKQEAEIRRIEASLGQIVCEILP